MTMKNIRMMSDLHRFSASLTLLFLGVSSSFVINAQSTLNDLDGDGCVGASDILVVLAQYGECNDPNLEWECGSPFAFEGYSYSTVIIGQQCWFAENLRSVNYADGSEILEVQSGDEWAALPDSSGARCVYQNDAAFYDEYGLLYNWYAVMDERGLCPSGWRIPSVEDDGDWGILKAFVEGLGYEAGDALKSLTGWDEGAGQDALGFGAVPGGSRAAQGVFGNAGTRASFWSTSVSPSFGANPDGSVSFPNSSGVPAPQGRSFLSTSPAMFFLTGHHRIGASVRCMRDVE